MTSGRLFLVPNLLGLVAPEAVLPARTIDVARRLAHYVVENAKPARAFLKSLAPELPMQAIDIAELGEAPTVLRCAELLAPVRAGHDIGLISDAGCPGIADPGALLVAQGFAFHGYLPVRAEERLHAIRRIESDSQRSGYAQLFIETPYRNASLLAALVATCKPATRLCVAADLTLETESVVSRLVRDWRDADFTRYQKRPALFVLQA